MKKPMAWALEVLRSPSNGIWRVLHLDAKSRNKKSPKIGPFELFRIRRHLLEWPLRWINFSRLTWVTAKAVGTEGIGFFHPTRSLAWFTRHRTWVCSRLLPFFDPGST